MIPRWNLKKLSAAVGFASLLYATPALAVDNLPTFSLPDLEGKTWTQSQFQGHPLVVDFWATWCNTCKETIPKLAELSQKFKGKGLTVLGISVDKGSDEKIAKAAKKLGINYLVLRDKDNTLAKAFGFNGIPSLYVFDKHGKLKSSMPGYDPDQEKALEDATTLALN
jgi:peroxiredoxin